MANLGDASQAEALAARIMTGREPELLPPFPQFI